MLGAACGDLIFLSNRRDRVGDLDRLDLPRGLQSLQQSASWAVSAVKNPTVRKIHDCSYSYKQPSFVVKYTYFVISSILHCLGFVETHSEGLACNTQY